jgi:MarR family transcriptional regulator for hemolysin
MQPVLACQNQRVAVTLGQQSGFAPIAAMPDRPHGMNDIVCGQLETCGDARFAGATANARRTFRQRPTGCKQRGSCGAVDRAIDATTAEQSGIGGIDDGIHAQLGDVGAYDCNVEIDRHGFGSGGAVCSNNDGGLMLMANTEDISFGYLLSDVTLLIRKHFDRRAVKFGLTRAQWRATRVLYHREGLRQTELAEFLEMEPIAVGRVIDRLQAAGFVERRPDPKDRRAWRLHTTEQARGIIDDMERIGRGLRKDATVGIDYDELQQAMAVITRMKENLLALEQDDVDVES